MMPIIIFPNQKGGCGKTTTSRELSLFTASLGKQVCIIDADPQGNLTKSLVSEDDIISGLYNALNRESYELMEVNENLWLLAGDKRLASLEKRLIGEMDAFTRLKDMLHSDNNIFADFDYIFIDSPPIPGNPDRKWPCGSHPLCDPHESGTVHPAGNE
jgi:chromosome partitioning protein